MSTPQETPRKSPQTRNCEEEGKTRNQWFFLIGLIILLVGLILGIWGLPVWDTTNANYYLNLIIIIIIMVAGGIVLGISSVLGKKKTDNCNKETQVTVSQKK
jgi:hypothetical protein